MFLKKWVGRIFKLFPFSESDLLDIDEELLEVDMEGGFHCALLKKYSFIAIAFDTVI